MTEEISTHTIWTLLLGLTVIASGLIEAGFTRLRIPALVGYLLLGLLLRFIDSRWGILDPPTRNAVQFLADIGVVALLFRVGLQSHPGALARKLPQAMKIWLGDVSGSALLGFVTSYYLLEFALIPSLIIATALTATSVGVSVAAWQSRYAIDSDNGRLLVDVAELDDISAVALMALLFVLIPTLHDAKTGVVSTLAATGASFAAKFVLFIAGCYLFSRYVEPWLTHFTAHREPKPQRMLTVIGVGFVIAALANWLGFSLAIGALFAGLVFSRDPKAIQTEKSFIDIYAFVTPFFFINIGLGVNPGQIVAGTGLGLILLLAAAAGKFIGAGTPALITSGATGAVLIGISMIPRAEITMIVIHQAQRLGNWALPQEIYAGIVFVSLSTCIIAPLILYRLLQRWPQTDQEKI
ncbi:cation:proton antiporter [Methylohalobius crimeensis]|uniref:cation:proton antiporter n=1 Tax=Methylohalobius crimeensis TaxID=244365 RepID=UPI0003B56125|nr:cation:proton antiporter [Methylohalobius crimeensis]